MIDLFSTGLAGLLLLLAGYFGWRQFQTLRRVVANRGAPLAERRFELRQARRRLVGCALMLILAAMLFGSVFLGEGVRALTEAGNDARARNEKPVLEPAQRQFLNAYSAYWSVALLVLLALVVTAGLDAYANIRDGVRRLQQLREASREELEVASEQFNTESEPTPPPLPPTNGQPHRNGSA